MCHLKSLNVLNDVMLTPYIAACTYSCEYWIRIPCFDYKINVLVSFKGISIIWLLYLWYRGWCFPGLALWHWKNTKMHKFDLIDISVNLKNFVLLFWSFPKFCPSSTYVKMFDPGQNIIPFFVINIESSLRNVLFLWSNVFVVAMFIQQTRMIILRMSW